MTRHLTHQRPTRVPARDIEAIPPHDLGAEQGLLAGILLDAATAAALAPRLVPTDFYLGAHQRIAQAIRAVDRAGAVPDAVTVRAELVRRRQWGTCEDALRALAGAVTTPGNASAYLAIVSQLAASRRALQVMHAGSEALREGSRPPSEVLAEVEAAVRARGDDLPQPPSSASRAVVLRMSDVTPEPVVWAWRPYLASGKLSLLEGDPGLGKTFVALAIATAVTRGTGLPGSEPTEPRNVVLLQAEDGAGDTLRPRLDRLGADCSRVFLVTAKETKDPATGAPREVPVTLADVETLEAVLAEHKPGLLIVDPIQAYLGGGVDMHRSNETRPLLAGLARLAQTHGCAAILIRHLSKGTAGRALYRGLGSIDFSAAARSVLLVGRDPSQPTGRRRIIAHLKSSLAAPGPSLAFDLDETHGFLWAGTSQLSAEELLAPDVDPEVGRERDGAKAFLREALARGPRAAKDLEAEALANGLSKHVLRRAREDLGVVVKKASMVAGWLWAFPSERATGPEDGSATFEGGKVPKGSTAATFGVSATFEDGKPTEDGKACHLRENTRREVVAAEGAEDGTATCLPARAREDASGSAAAPCSACGAVDRWRGGLVEGCAACRGALKERGGV